MRTADHRRIGAVEGGPGATVVVTGGLHGNEPAGVEAARRVVQALHGRRLRGTVVALRGNVAALRLGVRFVTRDLNRRWDEESIERLLRTEDAADEDHEQRELATELLALEAGARGPLVFLDLHSTSGEAPPFVCMADVLRNRDVAFALPLPVILGLEEVIDGAMLGWLTDRGHTGISVEGGRHDAPETVAMLEAAIWKVVVATGVLRAEEVPAGASHDARLARAARGLPRVVEIRHRHVVPEGEDFVMEPGWRSFAPVRRGQIVAHGARGAVAAGEDALMLMPRYQGQGDDGFFLAREVRPIWLRVSTWVRRLRGDRLVASLPGVRRHPQHADRLVVDPRIARARVTEIMHLCGYRRARPEGRFLVYSRRRPDRAGRR